MVNTSIRLGVALATLFNVAVVTATENQLSLDTTGGTANDTGFLGMLEEENDFDHGSSITERSLATIPTNGPKPTDKPTELLCEEELTGECMSKNDKKKCKGDIELMGKCNGKKDVCCVLNKPTEKPAELLCEEEFTGECMSKDDKKKCKEEIEPMGKCNGKKDVCCVLKKCPATRQCIKDKGSCINSKAFCDGKEDSKICKGKKCKCCIPDHTTSALSTCPTCPAPSTCPTTPATSTCPTCPAPSTCPTCPAPSTCPTCQACPTTSGPVECSSPWFPVGGQCFRVVGWSQKRNWTEARSYCRRPTVGGDLATPHNITALAEHLKLGVPGVPGHASYYWLGGSDQDNEGVWTWINGSSVITTGWAPGEPNDIHGDQDCLWMNAGRGAASLYNSKCSGLFPFVCMKPS